MEIDPYQYCIPAGTGTGGYCECNETLQPVGYFYDCKINWDCGHIYECLDGLDECLGTCAVTCGVLDFISCIACILEWSEECTNPCEFVEKCEKDEDNPQPITRPVFSGYGGSSSCEG